MRKHLKALIEDTLKKYNENGVLRYSRTSLTMFTAWVIAIYMAMIDFIWNGFRLDVWMTFVGVALGTKITDAFTKKIIK